MEDKEDNGRRFLHRSVPDQKVLRAQICSRLSNINKNGYSTTELITLLSFLNCADDDYKWMKHFTFYIRNIGKDREFSNVKDIILLQKRFKDFLWYLCHVRKELSCFEQMKSLREIYEDFYCTLAGNRTYLRDYVLSTQMTTPTGTIDPLFYECWRRASGSLRYKTTHLPSLDIIGEIKNYIAYKTGKKTFNNFGIKFPPYDGAHLVEPIPTINVSKPTAVIDYRSQYPSGIVTGNIGIELSLQYVLNHPELKENVDYYALQKRRCDDGVHFMKYVERSMTYYVDNNYIFFVSRNRVISVKNVAYGKTLKFRTDIKDTIARMREEGLDTREIQTECDSIK